MVPTMLTPMLTPTPTRAQARLPSAITDTPATRLASLTNPALVPAEAESALYVLVTDDVFLPSRRTCGSASKTSTVVGPDFYRAVPIGGDVAGQTVEGASRA